jgi:hypothetical protein
MKKARKLWRMKVGQIRRLAYIHVARGHSELTERESNVMAYERYPKEKTGADKTAWHKQS